MVPAFIMATASKTHVCMCVYVCVYVCVCVCMCVYVLCVCKWDVRMSEREKRKKEESCGALPYIYATYKKIKTFDKSAFALVNFIQIIFTK